MGEIVYVTCPLARLVLLWYPYLKWSVREVFHAL